MIQYKVGDEVIYQTNTAAAIRKVEKVTSSGQVTIDNGVRFTVDGYEISSSSRQYKARIRPATTEARAELAAEAQERADHKRTRELRSLLTEHIAAMRLADLETMYECVQLLPKK